MSSVPRRGTARGTLALLVAAGVGGVTTYALLVVVARALDAAHYSEFATFWSIVVILGFGAFLPVEQQTARIVAGGATPDRRHRLAVLAAVVAVVAAVVAVAAFLLVTRSGDVAVALCVAAAAAAQGWQFLVRGELAGRHRLPPYATVVVVDASGRLLAALVLVALGVHTVAPYAVAVVASSTAGALVGRVTLGRARGEDGPEIPRPVTDPRRASSSTTGALVRATGGLMVGALGMQLLLNGPPLVARATSGPGQVGLAGAVLATLSIARIPVLVLQAMQAAYVARVAAAAGAGRRSAVVGTVRVLAVLVGGVAVVAVALGSGLGRWVVSLAYGPALSLPVGVTAVVFAGAACYLVASVSNDLCVALGQHRTVVVAWVAGVAAAALVVVVVASPGYRAVAPLLAGALVAGIVLAGRLVVVTRRIGPA